MKPTVTTFTRSDEYRARVHRAIPGGAHTYSKGDDQYPQQAPAAIVRGQGAHVWDLDGNRFIDCSMALGSVSLGHAYPSVNAAVHDQIDRGVNFQRPASIELELAEAFIAAVPGADRVKFAKNGSTLTTAAVRLARAFTGRDLVAFPGNHSFYSYDDWFIGRSMCAAGIPVAVRELSVTYDSTRPDTLEALFRTYPNQIAAVISEPEEVIPGPPEAIQAVEALTKAAGAVFICDEMVSGYRAGWPGAFSGLGLSPDLVTWGKAIGNGYSFCAMSGRAEIMDLGGMHQTAHPRVFLVSTTHGGEAVGIAAALAVLREYQAKDVIGRQHQLTAAVADGWTQAATRHRLGGFLDVHASPWRVVTVCRDREGHVSAPLRTLLLQEMIARGALFQGPFVPCYSHSDEDVAHLIAAFDGSCAVYREALDHGVEGRLVGPPARPVFRKFTACDQLCPSTPCPLEKAHREPAAL